MLATSEQLARQMNDMTYVELVTHQQHPGGKVMTAPLIVMRGLDRRRLL